jgi:hypothetical protein
MSTVGFWLHCRNRWAVSLLAAKCQLRENSSNLFVSFLPAVADKRKAQERKFILAFKGAANQAVKYRNISDNRHEFNSFPKTVEHQKMIETALAQM